MVDTDLDLGELMELLATLRRTVLRTVRSATTAPDLSDAQVAVVRTLAAHGPTNPAALAERLHLARSTVSNLLRELTSSGFVERRPDNDDGRSVQIGATQKSEELLRRFDTARLRIMQDAVDGLSAAERTRLAVAVPVLRRIRDDIAARSADSE